MQKILANPSGLTDTVLMMSDPHHAKRTVAVARLHCGEAVVNDD
jgi:hypothetical protein